MKVSIKLFMAVVGFRCLLPAFALAEGETTPPPSLPSCTLTDITAVMASDPQCSLRNAVVFGANVVDFVTTQCAPFAVAPGSSDKKARSACIHCAKDAWSAFRTAAEAKLINAKPKKENLGQIKKLCGLNGGDKDNDGDESESDALKNLYGQLRLCLPQPDQQTNPDTCIACALNALDAALQSGTINQSKFVVMKTSIQAACSRTAPPHATPTPLPTPVGGENSFKKYGLGLRACFEKYITDKGRDAVSCLSCIQAVDATSLNPQTVSQYLEYAAANCSGPTMKPSPTPPPKPSPTPEGNSLKRFGISLNACFRQFITDNGRNASGCISCIQGVDAKGLDRTAVSSYLAYGRAHCNGTNI